MFFFAWNFNRELFCFTDNEPVFELTNFSKDVECIVSMSSRIFSRLNLISYVSYSLAEWLATFYIWFLVNDVFYFLYLAKMIKKETNKISYNYTMHVLQRILIEESEYSKLNYFFMQTALEYKNTYMADKLSNLVDSLTLSRLKENNPPLLIEKLQKLLNHMSYWFEISLLLLKFNRS